MPIPIEVCFSYLVPKVPLSNSLMSNHVLFYFFSGNLLKTPDGKLAFIDFGMMADIDEEDRYGLFGLVIGLQNKDLPLVTENLLKVRASLSDGLDEDATNTNLN